jgi:hypothetical protein
MTNSEVVVTAAAKVISIMSNNLIHVWIVRQRPSSSVPPLDTKIPTAQLLPQLTLPIQWNLRFDALTGC